MNIHVLGASGSCKTPFSEMVGKELGLNVISASEWIKPFVDQSKFKTKQEYVTEATEISMRELKKNPRSCVEFLESHYDLSKPSIIDGIKNPCDFFHLFELKKDVVVFLNRVPNPYQSTLFETGLVVIDKYVNWAATVGLLDKEKRINYLFEKPEKDLAEAVDNFVKLFRYRDWCVICGDKGCACRVLK